MLQNNSLLVYNHLNFNSMKNLFLTTALVVGLAVNANPIISNNSLEKVTVIETVSEVDAFCKLIQQGNLVAVKGMIDAGIDVNKKSVGMTPLMYAARQNKVEITKLLIASGADLKVKSNRGYTALKYAKISKAHDTFKIIADALEMSKSKKKGKSVII